MNLWFPRRVVDDIWRTSRPGVRADQLQIEPLPLSPLVRAWWLAFIANHLVRTILRFQFGSGDVTVGDFETIAVYSTIATGFLLLAGGLLIRVINQITEWQSTPRAVGEGTARQRTYPG